MLVLQRIDSLKICSNPYSSPRNIELIDRFGIDVDKFKELDARLGRALNRFHFREIIITILCSIISSIAIFYVFNHEYTKNYHEFSIAIIFYILTITLIQIMLIYIFVHKRLMKNAQIIINNENKNSQNFTYSLNHLFTLMITRKGNNSTNLNEITSSIDFYTIANLFSNRYFNEFQSFINDSDIKEIHKQIFEYYKDIRIKYNSFIALSIIALIEIYYLTVKYYVDNVYEKFIFATIMCLVLITLTIMAIGYNLNNNISSYILSKNDEWKLKGVYVDGNPIFLLNFYKIDKGYSPINECVMETFEKII
jgi:hypothetical protein